MIGSGYENEREYVKKGYNKNLVTLEEFLGRKDKEKAEIFINLSNRRKN